MDLLKLKKFDDAEGIVIAHNPGQDRQTGLMGSVTVRTEQGAIVRIGSGFSDDERRNPPPIGATITFKHQGFTASGKPRFSIHHSSIHTFHKIGAGNFSTPLTCSRYAR